MDAQKKQYFERRLLEKAGKNANLMTSPMKIRQILHKTFQDTSDLPDFDCNLSYIFNSMQFFKSPTASITLTAFGKLNIPNMNDVFCKFFIGKPMSLKEIKGKAGGLWLNGNAVENIVYEHLVSRMLIENHTPHVVMHVLSTSCNAQKVLPILGDLNTTLNYDLSEQYDAMREIFFKYVIHQFINKFIEDGNEFETIQDKNQKNYMFTVLEDVLLDLYKTVYNSIFTIYVQQNNLENPTDALKLLHFNKSCPNFYSAMSGLFSGFDDAVNIHLRKYNLDTDVFGPTIKRIAGEMFASLRFDEIINIHNYLSCTITEASIQKLELIQIIGNTAVNEMHFMMIVFQIIWTLQVFNLYGLRHNDLHLGNIFVEYSTQPWTLYYEIPETGEVFGMQTNYFVKVFDYDHSTINSSFLSNFSQPISIKNANANCFLYNVCNVHNAYHDTFQVICGMIGEMARLSTIPSLQQFVQQERIEFSKFLSLTTNIPFDQIYNPQTIQIWKQFSDEGCRLSSSKSPRIVENVQTRVQPPLNILKASPYFNRIRIQTLPVPKPIDVYTLPF